MEPNETSPGKPSTGKTLVPWYDRPGFRWGGTAVAFVMLTLSLRRASAPHPIPGIKIDVIAWSVMFVAWLAVAVYTTWFRKKK